MAWLELGTDPAVVFDTPGLALNRAGLVVRARRVSGDSADTVVKLHPVLPSELPDSIRHFGSFKLEVDIVSDGFVCSGSLKGKAKDEEARTVAVGEMRLSQILSKEQWAFYRQHAPRELALDALTLLGPTFALKSAFWAKQLDREMVAEMWLYPDGSRLLEWSTKCLPAESPVVVAELSPPKRVDTMHRAASRSAVSSRPRPGWRSSFIRHS